MVLYFGLVFSIAPLTPGKFSADGLDSASILGKNQGFSELN